MAELPCAVMISGYPSELYDQLLPGWHKTEFDVGSQVGLREEAVWHNFKPSPVLHDYSHFGDDFRERERLKRKAERWRRRLEALPEGERRALMSAMNDLIADSPLQPEAIQS
ncbi:DNA methylase [Sphingomonas aracearum]|uniref:DNA methylase n=1 Tax=Sphingomonas aracearum TaxID=2283317 RepID=UPI0011C023FD|nr:DNA methylase [Sphingomonas aracearum]